MTEKEVRVDMVFLQTQLMRRDAKYLRNLNRYTNNGQRRENIYELYNNPVAYYFSSSDSDTGPWPIENVIKSCIDTKVSKMSQVKVRPFFNPVNGKWKTRKVCRVGQQFWDEYFQRHHVYHEAIESYRDALVFEVGHVWVNDQTRIPRRIKPWEYYSDPAEQNYGEISRDMVRFWKFPLIMIKDKIKQGTRAAQALARDIHAKADELHIYYDLDGGKKFTFVEEELIETASIKFEVSTVASLYCNPPIKGKWTTSLVDDLITLQRELDIINQKIHDATVLTPANLMLVPTIGGVKKSKFDAGKEGLIYEYEPVPGVHTPAEWIRPSFVDPQWLIRRQQIMETMYNLSGVSQLSAQSKKPSGINSGVALDTLEDVESERHNFELQEYEKFCMQICETGTRVFDEKELVLPGLASRSGVTWKDIQEERDAYSVQFSPASALSNTPKVKMEQVEKLQKMGYAGPEWAAEFLQFPDLEKVYSIATANRNDIEAITERAGERAEFDFYEAVNIDELYKNVMNEIMRLDADEPENGAVIENLVEFSKAVNDKKQLMLKAAQPPVPPVAPPPAAPPVSLGQDTTPIPQGQNALGPQTGGTPGIAPVLQTPPPPPVLPAPAPMPSEDPALMQAIQALGAKLDMVSQIASQALAASMNQQPAAPLTVVVDGKNGKTREITQYTRDARGEMIASDKQIIPIEEAPVMPGVV